MKGRGTGNDDQDEPGKTLVILETMAGIGAHCA